MRLSQKALLLLIACAVPVLLALQSAPPPPLATCSVAEIAVALAAVPPYVPVGENAFIRAEGRSPASKQSCGRRLSAAFI